MNTIKTISIVDEGEKIALNSDFEDRLVGGGIIYYCDECKVYHIDADHDWKSLAQALHTIRTDIAALSQPRSVIDAQRGVQSITRAIP